MENDIAADRVRLRSLKRAVHDLHITANRLGFYAARQRGRFNVTADGSRLCPHVLIIALQLNVAADGIDLHVRSVYVAGHISTHRMQPEFAENITDLDIRTNTCNFK